MAAKLDQILSALGNITQTLSAHDAAIAALSNAPTAQNLAAPAAPKTAPTVAAGSPAAPIIGTLTYVARGGKAGAILDVTGGKANERVGEWVNPQTGTTPFLGFEVGQYVCIETVAGKTGKPVAISCELVGTAASPRKGRKPAVQTPPATTAVVPVTGASDQDEIKPCKRCAIAGRGVKHANQGHEPNVFLCLSRQYRAAGNSLDVASGTDWLSFAQWLVATAPKTADAGKGKLVTVTVADDDGGDDTDPTPAGPAPKPIKRGKGDAKGDGQESGKGAQKGAPSNTVTVETAAADAAVIAAAEKMLAPVKECKAVMADKVKLDRVAIPCTVTGISSKTPGLICLMHPTMPGAKGKGVYVSTRSESIRKQILKLAVGDGVRVTIADGYITAFEITQKAPLAGVATSGKNEPAQAPARHPSMGKRGAGVPAKNRKPAATTFTAEPNCADCNATFGKSVQRGMGAKNISTVTRSTVDQTLCTDCAGA